jgi:hypothetical protein
MGEAIVGLAGADRRQALGRGDARGGKFDLIGPRRRREVQLRLGTPIGVSRMAAERFGKARQNRRFPVLAARLAVCYPEP